MKITSERLLLTPITMEFVDLIYRYFTDEITFYMYPKPPNNIEETIAFVSQSIKNYEQKEEIVFVALDKDTQEFLGLTGIHEIHTRTPEVGLWLKKDAHGHHYGLEGIEAILNYAKSTLDYDYIIYNCDIRNGASRNIAETLSGIPVKTYKEINLSGKELHYVQYWIYKQEPTDIRFPVLLFQGDSITDANRNKSQPYDLGEGYVSKLLSMNHHAVIINKGISGNRTIDLLNRWEIDTLTIQPDFLSILIGINEVWHHYKYGNILTPTEYKHNYIKLLNEVKEKSPQTKILMIEPFVFPIGEYEPIWQTDLYEEQKIVEELAQTYADYYIPMQSILNSYLKNYQMSDILGDGVHPSDLGHQLIAKEITKVLRLFMIDYFTKQNIQ
jgi:RimJ/RimL family protein N-acetyltransferase/lysophospholipase L1-like esterase